MQLTPSFRSADRLKPSNMQRKASAMSVDVMVQLYGANKLRQRRAQSTRNRAPRFSTCVVLQDMHYRRARSVRSRTPREVRNRGGSWLDEPELQSLSLSVDDLAVSRKDLRYGVAMSCATRAKETYKARKVLFDARVRICDICLALAFLGTVLAMVEVEIMTDSIRDEQLFQRHTLSTILRSFILGSTIVLVILVIAYNVIEAKIVLVDTGSDYWRVAVNRDRIFKTFLEVFVCSICPVPGTGYITWSYFKPNLPLQQVQVPLEVVLSIPMFLRSYLIGRFMVLHSRQFQDAATRTIAVMNQIAVDFNFVLKTKLARDPLTMIIIFSLSFWVVVAWMVTQCERFNIDGSDISLGRHYINYCWFVIVTFFQIGYGDIVPSTYCGRSLAITSGLVGAFVSSVLIAVISQKIQLSFAEKHVNQVRAESHVTLQLRNAAAQVLQFTWLLHKWKKLWNDSDISFSKGAFKVRLYQRLLLQGIMEFRRLKRRKRILAEKLDDLTAFKKFQHDMNDRLEVLNRQQRELQNRLLFLSEKISSMYDKYVKEDPEFGDFHSAIYVPLSRTTIEVHTNEENV